jgi:hypothetical protein
VSDAQVVGDAGDRCGVAVLPLGGERGGLVLGDGDRLLAGLGLANVEDRPEVGLHLGLVVRGHLGQHIAGAGEAVKNRRVDVPVVAGAVAGVTEARSSVAVR